MTRNSRERPSRPTGMKNISKTKGAIIGALNLLWPSSASVPAAEEVRLRAELRESCAAWLGQTGMLLNQPERPWQLYQGQLARRIVREGPARFRR